MLQIKYPRPLALLFCATLLHCNDESELPEDARAGEDGSMGQGGSTRGAASAGQAGSGGSITTQRPDIGGTWRVDCVTQSNGGQQSHLSFEITDEGEAPRFIVMSYADAECTTPLFSVGNESERVVGDPITGIPGAYELDIHYQKLFATAHSEGGAALLEQFGCGTGFEVAVEKDVSATGCLFFQPIGECAADYDIVKIEGDKFYNGVRREVDMCVPEGRPVELTDFPFVRIP